MKIIILAIILLTSMLYGGDEMIKFKELTTEEERVIIQKGTETPFTGKFYKNDNSGTYLCKRCDKDLEK